MKYFLIGIKGTGMAALAHILKDMGNCVVGSDIKDYVFTEDELLRKEIEIYPLEQYDISDVDVVISGHNFYPNSNEVKRAFNKGKIVYEYNQFLSKLIKEKYSIAICGSHGKTTSVGLLATIMKRYNPSYLRGDGIGKWTNSKYIIFEACEYKNHYLAYEPDEIIILNIDYDHCDFFKTREDYIDSFVRFSKHCKNRLYIHDSILEINNIKENIISNDKELEIYTFGNKTNLKNQIFKYKKIEEQINFYSSQEELISNELGLIECALNNNVAINEIKENIKLFNGARKRKEEIILKDNLIVDDYAHHPKQIKVIIEEMILKYPNMRVVAIFKPDRYSRILKFHKEIKEALSKADEVYVIDFPENAINDTDKIFNATIIGYNVLSEDVIYNKIKDYKNTIYLLLSSKDMSYLKNKLKKY